MYSIKTQLKRWYRWRFSGPITIIGIFAIGIFAWNQITSNIDFFEKMTCPQMVDYYKDTHVREGMPMYSELTDAQKEKYESLMKPCIDAGWHKVQD